MDKTAQQNIQDAFLNTLRREKLTISISLMSGSSINGRLKSFDKFSVLLDSNGREFLVFKHAIATVSFASRKPFSESENQPKTS
ncbi:MAG: RNA chaperone Hfq [Pyrinomonadaceae bacterium]|nr:RNA chaperone Hfq [Pyrinomonadaceae bacterium]